MKLLYQLADTNGCTVDIWEWISDDRSPFIMEVIIYPCWYFQLSMIAKGAPDGIVLNYGSPNSTNDDWKVEHVFSYFIVLSITPYQLYEPDDAF